MYLMGIFSQYYSNLRPTYFLLVVQVFCYLFGTLDFKITFQINSSNELVGYINSDYIKLIDSQKSIGKYKFIISSWPLSHQSKLQNTIVLSSSKAKYMAACKVKKKAWWVFWLPTLPVNLCVDNKGAIFLTENPEFYQRTKHIEV